MSDSDEISDKLLHLCQFSDNDEGFNSVFVDLQKCVPILSPTDLFLSSQFSDRLSSIDSSHLTEGLIFGLLSLHFKRNSLPPKSRSYGKFVGKLTRRKGLSDYCVYFPVEHLTDIFKSLFNCQEISKTILLNMWNSLRKGHSSSELFDMKRFLVCTCNNVLDSVCSTKVDSTTKSNNSNGTAVKQNPSLPPVVASSPSNPVSKVLVNKGIQTWHSKEKFVLMSKGSESKSAAKISELSSTVQVLTDKIKSLEADGTALRVYNEQLLNENSFMTNSITKLTEAVAEQTNKLKEANKARCKLLDECRALEDQLCQFEDATDQVDDLTQSLDSPEFGEIALHYKNLLELGDSSLTLAGRQNVQIPMRTSRKSINPAISIAIMILRQVGHCSLEKTSQTLVLLGNIVFGQKWVLSSDISNKRARQRSMIPEGTSSSASDGTTEQISGDKKKRTMHAITSQTAPTQGFIRKNERTVLTPLALQSVTQELKSPNCVDSTLMYDGAKVNRSKVITVGVMNAIKDPESGKVTTHYRQTGIEEMVNSDASSTTRAVTATLRSAAVLDSASTDSDDIRKSMKSMFDKIDHVVTDMGSEMRPVADNISNLKLSLGHEKGVQYIHCNAHVSPAFDTAIDKELREIEKMFELKDHISRGFNSSFFNTKSSITCTMLHAIFSMFGTSLYRQKEQSWSCNQDFNSFLEAREYLF